jgi:hypothetical protein
MLRTSQTFEKAAGTGHEQARSRLSVVTVYNLRRVYQKISEIQADRMFS